MPYKRKAHVLFVGSGEVCRALLAATLANTLGEAWMEARAVALQGTFAAGCALPGIDLSAQTLPNLDAENIAWADLVVALDEAAAQACVELPKRIQQRCYAVAPAGNAEDWGRVRAAIQQRIEGMIGGMRMLA